MCDISPLWGKKKSKLLACVALPGRGFKCWGDPASRWGRRYNRYVFTIPCNVMINSRCSSEAAIDTPSGEEKGTAAIEIVQK